MAPGKLTGRGDRPKVPTGGTVTAGRSWENANAFGRWAEVTSVEALTTTATVRIGLKVRDHGSFEFVPGQYVTVRGPELTDRVTGSPYCIASPPLPDRRFQLLVRVVPDGPVAQYLSSRQPGDIVRFRGPAGKSMLPPNDTEDVVLLATGVGIGPFLPLCHYLLAGGWQPSIRLFWGLRSPEDVCLLDELQDMARRWPNFSYQLSLSRPDAAWTGLRGRLTESVPPLIERLGGTRFYLCGNGSMIEEIATVLSDLGVARDHIRDEPYLNKDYRPDPEVLDAIRHRFAARDLFSPYFHQVANLYLPERKRPTDG